MAKVKERSGGRKLPASISNKPKELGKRGAEQGGEKLKEQFRDASGRGDSAEEYGGDKVERGAESASEKAVRTAENTGGRIKGKIADKVRDRFARDERQPEQVRERPDTEVPQRDSNEAVRGDSPVKERQRTAETHNKPENIREKDCSSYEQPSEQIAVRERVYSEKYTELSHGNEDHNGATERRMDIKEKPEVTERTIKTKDQYIREQTKAPEAKSEDRSKKAHTQSKPEAQHIQNKPQTNRPANTRLSYGRTVTTAKSPAQTAGKSTIKVAEKGSVKTAQAAGKGTVKATKTGVKTAERTAKTSAKAAKTTAKTAQKAAQAAAKAAKAAAQAAARAAKVVAKAVATAVKAIIAAIKGLIAAIAAGGWVAVVIILAIALVAFILCACFGVFASNETGEEGTKPMTDAIIEIDTSYKAGIDSKISELSTGDYDEVVVEYVGDMDGDSSFLINWNDVIAVYSVTVTMDKEAPTDVVEVTPEKIAKLKEIFADMNTVSYNTEVVETEEVIENEDGEEETVTHRKLIIHVDVKSLDYLAAADMYGFDDTQRQALEAMMEPRMLALYAELIGIDVYGGADLTKIISGLPAGRMGSDVLRIALTKVGAPYVLGAKGPNRFDCSGLVYWSIHEIDASLGRNLYTSAGYQYKYCRDNGYLVGESELMSGDIIFWYKPSCTCGKKYNEVHHTGFYLGDGMILDASSSNGRVIIRKLFNGSSYKVLAYARPYSY